MRESMGLIIRILNDVKNVWENIFSQYKLLFFPDKAYNKLILPNQNSKTNKTVEKLSLYLDRLFYKIQMQG